MGLDNKQAFFICSNENVIFEVDWNATGLIGFDASTCVCYDLEKEWSCVIY